MKLIVLQYPSRAVKAFVQAETYRTGSVLRGPSIRISRDAPRSCNSLDHRSETIIYQSVENGIWRDRSISGTPRVIVAIEDALARLSQM